MPYRPHVSIGLVYWIDDNKQLPELKRCLDSLTDFYPVFAVNGKWDDMKGNNIRSTDEAYDLVESYSNVIQILSPNRPEAYNRNLYLIMARRFNSDFLFWVDSDEWIEMPCGKEFFLKELRYRFGTNDFASRVFYTREGKDGFWQTRIVQYPGFLRHRDKHNRLYFGDREVLQYSIKAPMGLIIHSDKNFRSKERERNMFNRVEGIKIV